MNNCRLDYEAEKLADDMRIAKMCWGHPLSRPANGH